MSYPFLMSKNIYLRGLEVGDADGNYSNWLNDEEVCKYSEHHVFPYTRNMAIEYISSLASQKDKLMLAIIDTNKQVHIGNVTLSAISHLHKSAEFSIMIGNKDFHNKGLAKEASFLMLNHGFNTMNLHRIWCGTMQNNLPMQKLALWLGMKEEGIVRDEVYKNGQYHNCIRFGTLKDEFNHKFAEGSLL